MDTLEINRKKMVGMLERMARPEGMHATALAGVKTMRASRPAERVAILYEPSIIFVAQGRKRGYLGEERFVYDASNFLLLTVPLPFECSTEMGKDGPFLGVALKVDLGLVSELMMTMGMRAVASEGECLGGVQATALDVGLSDAVVRLVECLQTPVDAQVLGPQMVREVMYRVLRGQRGGALQQLLPMDETRLQMHRVLHRMHADYARPLNIGALASELGMSISALHHHFKAVTDTSPLQYLKTVRLHKARMFMVQDAVGAATAAERVGYESPSQFSREFRRMFQASPVEETERMRGVMGMVLPDGPAARGAITS
jgi:AraC-like DNA-binding protein